MQENLKPRHRWYRFSLRTLFVLFTILSLPLGWIGYQLNWIRERESFRRAHFAAEYNEEPEILVDLPTPNPPEPLQWFGERGTTAWRVKALSKTEIQEAQRLFPEAQLVNWGY